MRPSFSTFSSVVGIAWGLLGPGNRLLPLQLSWWEELLLLSCLSGSLTGWGFRRRIAPSFTPRSSEQVLLSCGGDGEVMDCNRTPAVLSWGSGGWLGWGSRAGQPQERLSARGPLQMQSPGLWSGWSWGCPLTKWSSIAFRRQTLATWVQG